MLLIDRVIPIHLCLGGMWVVGWRLGQVMRGWSGRRLARSEWRRFHNEVRRWQVDEDDYVIGKDKVGLTLTRSDDGEVGKALMTTNVVRLVRSLQGWRWGRRYGAASMICARGWCQEKDESCMSNVFSRCNAWVYILKQGLLLLLFSSVIMQSFRNL
jgi:hypothetical protein